jgi:hypothetical protein
MIIWFAVFVPLLSIPFLIWRFPHKVVWWELAVPVLSSILLIAACKASIEAIQTTDTEYWGGHLTQAEYYEAWNERVSCRHPKYKTVRNKDGTTSNVQDGYEHAYDVDYHPSYREASDSNGITVSISSDHFEQLTKRFSNRQFVDLHRSYHTIDGDKYVTKWDGQEETLEPFTSVHRYENRVACSDSIFNFEKVDPKQYGLFEYPEIFDSYRCRSILGGPVENQDEAERRLSLLNATLGRVKQIRVWVLVYYDKPMAAAYAQQQYWKNGNKNELIIAVGLNQDQKVSWAQVFSWTDKEQFKADVRSKLIEQEGQPLNLVSVVDWLQTATQRDWVRKEFKDFSYITVEPPGWAIALSFFLTFIVTAGCCWWVVKNQFEEK